MHNGDRDARVLSGVRHGRSAECVEAYSDEEQLFGLNQLRSNYQTRILSTEELLRELQDARQQIPAWEK